jgi:hypothetical protein
LQDIKQFIENKLYFNEFTGKDEIIQVKSLITEVLQRIESINSSELLNVIGNVEFIIYKPIEGDNAGDAKRSQAGGVTIKCEIEKSETQKSCWRVFIIYYPIKRFDNRDTQLFILAHELAHALFCHPINNPMPTPEEKDILEHQADGKAIEWGFRPNEKDIDSFPTYKKYYSK